MSNLKLPNLDYKPLLDSLNVEQTKTVAYATKVERYYDAVHILHHDSRIATIRMWSLWIDTHGYNSRTTVDRLHRILRDNGVPYGVAIRGGIATLIKMDDTRTIVAPLHLARFYMVAGVWTLASLNGKDL